ncbi:cardiolipin synthase [Clostridium gasigenes]|uniref:cardiolipin synthase n=1 Tax=Clostridium gasigenes TaxID=94869 RepID=UPI0014382AA1|nr:cardiolipin synthase [Clostridium gasigenes]NKF08794.1 cardiolipin synthase [Clostridium gasigenes]QSW20866.1 cardiolipin synthase [Clostridium gasigenes]
MYILLLIILFFLLINIILVSTVVVLEKKRPEKTLAWILVLIFLPPIGLLLYIFLGRSWKINKLDKTISFSLKELLYPLKFSHKLNKYGSLMELLAANSYSPVFTNNSIKVLNGGSEKFDALKKELLKATNHIHLEYYIVKDDVIGNEIKDILIKKSLEGITVRFIIDRIGSSKLSHRYVKELKSAGVEVVFYSHFLAPFLRIINTQINYRNHRKIIVIDGEVGFLGGINIGDEYLGKGELGNWRDCHFMIKGDFVLGLQSVFLDDYSIVKKSCNEDYNIPSNIENYFKTATSIGSTVMQLTKSGPDSEYPSIMQSIIKMISMAKTEVNIITPYFIPPEALVDTLRIAILSGITVKIIYPKKADHFMVNRASLTYIAELVRCGAKVYLYSNKGFIHSKILTVDNEICTVGTANMDIRSFELNYEINTVIYDKYVTEDLNNIFLQDLKNCTDFNLDTFDKSSLIDRFINGLCRLFSSIL